MDTFRPLRHFVQQKLIAHTSLSETPLRTEMFSVSKYFAIIALKYLTHFESTQIVFRLIDLIYQTF